MANSDRFEPKIMGFLCNWCSYAGADLAGVSRFQYPPNMRVIRVMCSGRVDPKLVLEAFVRGMDGVLVLGCHFGDCHYITGNYLTEKRVKMTTMLLSKAGLIPERLYLGWVSAAEGERFANIVKNFTEQIKGLGPLGEREELEPEGLGEELFAALQACQDERLRWLTGVELRLVKDGNAYKERVSQEEFDALMSKTVHETFIQKKISMLIDDHPLSVKETAARIGLSPRETLRHMVALERSGEVSLAGIVGNTPKYIKSA